MTTTISKKILMATSATTLILAVALAPNPKTVFAESVDIRHEQVAINKKLTTDISNYMTNKQILLSVEYFEPSRPLDHTMCFSLDQYVQQKLPTKLIQKAVINNWNIEVHGIFPLLFSQYSNNLGFDAIEHFEFNHNKKVKKYNYIRPTFFIGYKKNQKNTLIISVTPGEDYIYHYSSMIRHYLLTLTNKGKNLMTIHRYPELEKKLADWTNLDKQFVMPNDIVILGSVEILESHLKEKINLELINSNENEYYGTKRYKLPNGKIVNFLGVKYSYWGSMSANIVSKLCELEVSEIIYSAKLGSLTKPEDLYNKIYSPTKYLTMKSHKVTEMVANLPNKFVKKFPELNSNWHVSIPTVLEEDFEQRRIAKDMGVESIDNEISCMAVAINNYNQKYKKDVSFFTAHFATDYVRAKEENGKEVAFDLSNNRTKDAMKKKLEVNKNITGYLSQYLVEE